MKTFLFIILFCASNICVNAQYWSSSVKISSGNDYNPVFANKQGNSQDGSLLEWEFMLFERRQDISSSHIYVMKIDTSQMPLSTVQLTSGSFINRNPSLACYYFTFQLPNHFLAGWETNRNGRWDLYGRYYNNGTWNNENALDTTAGDKSSLDIFPVDAAVYSMVYEKNGDIMFKKFNVLTGEFTEEANLTAADSFRCSNPKIKSNYVTYERNYANGDKGLYCITGSQGTWQQPVVIKPSGVIKNNIITRENEHISIYDYRDSVSQKIKAAFLPNGQEAPIEQRSNADNFNYRFYFYPDITESFGANTSGYLTRGQDSTKAMLRNYYQQYDTITIADTSFNEITMTMSGGIQRPQLIYVYAVYNTPDSLGNSNLWATKIRVTVAGIIKSSSELPAEYTLSQNYPNPFNPSTKINFAIPTSGFVNLKVYDMTGREVANLVKQELQAGTYTVDFNGANLSSGVYFYTLQAGSFTATKKLVLTK